MKNSMPERLLLKQSYIYHICQKKGVFMAGPVGQLGLRLDNHQNVDNLGGRVGELTQKVKTVLQQHTEAKARLDAARQETDRLRPLVVNTVTAAGGGGCVGFVASRVLGSSALVMAIATAGTALLSRFFAYYFTK
jgi:hypothetical protein